MIIIITNKIKTSILIYEYVYFRKDRGNMLLTILSFLLVTGGVAFISWLKPE